jgi:hypothetical protein
MATVIAAADGNFTGSIWATVDATSLLNSQANSTTLTTSFVESATFTPGAITIDGIAVKVATRAASPTGTMTVRLAQAGVTVVGTDVTIDVSDIQARNGEQGWVLFKFAAPVLLVAATLYTVSARTSSATQVTLFRNSTAGNWSRLLRTTTVGTIGAGDNFHVLKEWTAAATGTVRAVTMDSTAATDYGDNAKTAADYSSVGDGCTLAYAFAAATNYVLRLSTVLRIQFGGTFTIGTIGSEIPRNSTAVLEFNCDVADGDFGLECYGTASIRGLSRSVGKDVVQCLLNTDEAAGQTVLGVDTDTGWLNADEIGIAPTSTTPSQAEARILSGAAGASSMTVTAGLTNAHLGTSPMQAEVILLSRNVEVRSTSTTLMAYVFVGGAATWASTWTLYRYLGSNTAAKRGIEVVTTAAGSASFAYCAARDFDRHGFYLSDAALDNVTLSHVVTYGVGSKASADAAIGIKVSTTGVNWSITDCTVICTNQSGVGIALLDVGGVVQRIRVSGAGQSTQGGVQVNEPTGIIGQAWSNWNVHSCQGYNISLQGLQAGIISDVDSWRAAGSSVGITGGPFGVITLDTWRMWGSTTSSGEYFSGTTILDQITWRSCLSAGDTGAATPRGVSFGAASAVPIGFQRFENCSFSPTSGIFVPHTTSDFNLGSSQRVGYLTFVDTLLGATTEIEGGTLLAGRSYLQYQSADQVAGVNQRYYPQLGTSALDTSIFRTAAPSEKLTPVGAVPGFRLRSGVRYKPVALGATLNPAVWVQKDGSYVGSAARLLLLANPSIGVDDDVVIATHTAAAGVWELLSAATPAATQNGVMAFVIEVDGSAGNVYLDDWA